MINLLNYIKDIGLEKYAEINKDGDEVIIEFEFTEDITTLNYEDIKDELPELKLWLNNVKERIMELIELEGEI